MFKITISIEIGGKKFPRKRESEPKHRLIDLVDEEILGALQNRSISTLANYRTAITSMLEFAGIDICMEDFSPQLMTDYQAWLRRRGICLNTVSCYMRSLRTLYKRVMEPDDLKQPNPFSKVFTGNTATGKRAISPHHILNLSRLNLPCGSRLELSRNVFLFCFYALGMPFVDVAFLRRSQLEDNRITYSRRKTGQRISLKLEPCMKAIIDYYKCCSGEYVFPILTSDNHEDARREYNTRLAEYNRDLKRLAKLAGIKTKLTSYVVRHTWASAAYCSNMQMPLISKALGHTNAYTTQVYIRGMDNSKLDRANRFLLSSIFKKLSGDDNVFPIP